MQLNKVVDSVQITIVLHYKELHQNCMYNEQTEKILLLLSLMTNTYVILILLQCHMKNHSVLTLKLMEFNHYDLDAIKQMNQEMLIQQTVEIRSKRTILVVLLMMFADHPTITTVGLNASPRHQMRSGSSRQFSCSHAKNHALRASTVSMIFLKKK